MLGAYRQILNRSTAPFSVAGLIGRFPLSMTGFGIVLLAGELGHDYTTAGLLSACYVISSAIFGPIQGKIADRHGQRGVLLVAPVIFTAGMIAFLLLLSANLIAAGVAAAVAGIGAPQAGSMVRTRWTRHLGGSPKLSTAFAWEGVLDEVVFICGPVLATFLTLNAAQESALGVAVLCALIGSWALAAHRKSAPLPEPATNRRDSGLPWASLAPLVAVALCLGMIFGSVELVIVAFVSDFGHRNLAGVILALWAGGSLAAGFVTGLAPTASPVRRLRLTTCALAASMLIIMPAGNIVWLSLAMLASGLFIAPTLIGMVTIVERSMPAPRLTEALAWTTTGLAVGVAPGAALAGALTDSHGSVAGLFVPLLAGCVAFIIACFFVTDSDR